MDDLGPNKLINIK